jgi:adenylylsulfate kinase-like enzyme
MIWITGNSGSGKTTLAKRLRKDEVLLDGDDLRGVWTDLDLSEAGRREQNLRVARLARLLADQGFGVIVATICPYRDLRARVQAITGCRFVYLPGGKSGPEYPYEPFD